MTQVERINARGYARGWYADQLASECRWTGETMAERFWRTGRGPAFNVPAECTRVVGAGAGMRRIFYRFADGSTLNFLSPTR